jgi:hypothetical protein
MARLKAIPFIVVGTVVHLALGVLVVGARINCDFREKCISTTTRVVDWALSFPFAMLVALFHLGGGPITGFTLFLVLLNSLSAVTIVWFALIYPFVRRSRRRAVADRLAE